MRAQPVKHVSCLVVLLFLVAGCVSPKEAQVNPTEEADKAADLILVDGWTHQASGGEFRFQNGALEGRFTGDQIALPLHVTESMKLEDLGWVMSGRLNVEEHPRATLMFVAWRMTDPWPQNHFFRTSNVESATINGEFAGQRISYGVGEPRFSLDENGNIGNETEWTWAASRESALKMDPGNWLLWVAAGQSYDLNMTMTIPEGSTLWEPPRYGATAGCDMVQPSEFDAQMYIQASLIATYAEELHWSVDVPENKTFVGAYMGGTGLSPLSVLGTNRMDYRFEFPDGPDWSLLYEAVRQTTEPPDWGGRLLASTMPGTHHFELVEEKTALLDFPPKIVYCIL